METRPISAFANYPTPPPPPPNYRKFKVSSSGLNGSSIYIDHHQRDKGFKHLLNCSVVTAKEKVSVVK
jgi:hypothetical protein